VRAPVPSSWLAAVVSAASGQLTSKAQVSDVGRLLQGLVRVRPELPQAWLDNGIGSGSEDDAPAMWNSSSSSSSSSSSRSSSSSSSNAQASQRSSRSSSSSSSNSNTAGTQLWAAEHQATVNQLLAATVPLLPACGARELSAFAHATESLSLTQHTGSFVSALSQAVDQLAARVGDGGSEDLEAVRSALQRLQSS